MILANLTANLMAISSLTFFLDRLIIDGKYKTVQLTFDDAYVSGHDLVIEIAKLAIGKYAMAIQRANYNPLMGPAKTEPQRSDSLSMIKTNYVEGGEVWFFDSLAQAARPENSGQNLVLLLPMLSEDRKTDLWHRIGFYLNNTRTIVVFYETSVEMRVPVETCVYALNYKKSNGLFKLDVEKFLFHGHPNETDLHEKMFKTSLESFSLRITTNTVGIQSVTKRSSHEGSKQVINLGDADCYLSNFIARNSHFENFSIEQNIRYEYFTVENEMIQSKSHKYSNTHDSSIKRSYSELYNGLHARISGLGE